MQCIDFKLDIFAIAKTKIEETFPDAQFQIAGFQKPYRLSANSGGIFLFVKHGIFSNFIFKHEEIQLRFAIFKSRLRDIQKFKKL